MKHSPLSGSLPVLPSPPFHIHRQQQAPRTRPITDNNDTTITYALVEFPCPVPAFTMSLDLPESSAVSPSGAAAGETSKPSTLDMVSAQGIDALKDITFGSIAGIVGKFIEYPFDTVKVRLQSQPDHRPLRYAGPLDCFKQSLRQDGFLGIYRGISAPLVGAAVETSSLFFSVIYRP